MNLSLTIKNSRLSTKNIAFIFIFIYFLFLHAERINLPISIFKFGISHFLAITLTTLMILYNKYFLLDKNVFKMFVLLSSSFIISLFLGDAWYRCAGYFFYFCFCFLFYFFLPLNLIKIFGFEKIFKTYCISFISVGAFILLQFLLSLFGIFIFMTQDIGGKMIRPCAFNHEPSYYALYMAAFTFFINTKYMLRAEKLNIKEKALALCANLFLLLSTSTGAFFAYFIFFVGLAILSLNKSLKLINQKFKKTITKFILYFSLGLALLSIAFHEIIVIYFKFFTTNPLSHYSFWDRWSGLVNALKVFYQNPFFGVGWGGVGPYICRKVAEGKEFLLASLSLNDPSDYISFDPTNIFTEILASIGLFGFLCIGIALYGYFNIFRKTFQMALTTEERINILSFLMSILVIGIMWQFSQGLFRPYIWVHFAVAFGYVEMLNQKYSLEPLLQR